MESLLRSIATISFAASAILCLFGSTGCEARRVTDAEAELTASVSVTPGVAAVTVQGTVSLSAVAKNVAGAILQDRPITWSSANPSVATVSSDGNVTGIATGVATVVATSDGQRGTSTISVTPVPVSSVEVIPSAARIPVGDSLQLAAFAKDAGNTPLPDRAMAWSSSHASIARVTAAGLVTAVAVGTAYVIATSEGKSDTSAIEVSEPPVASVAVEPPTATVEAGRTVQLSATMRDANGTVLAGRVVTWTSSNDATATVSSSGMVTGVAQGSASITAISEGRSGTSVITVVTPPPLVVDAGADQAITLGTSASLNGTVTSNGPGPLRMFWSKISGPGSATFSHDQFTSSFEDGTISEWTAPNEWGYVGGQQNGGGFVSQDMAHSGTYSWKGYNDPSLPPPENYSAKISRWRFDYPEGYYSAWYWWPPDRNVAQGEPIIIFQFKERTAPYDPPWLVNAKRVNGQDIVGLWDWYGRVAHDNPAALLPKGRWFHVAAYQKVSRTSGELTVWLDGVRVYNLSGINTVGAPTNTTPPFLMWGIANYAPVGTSGIGTHLYVDDAAVSNVTDPRSTSVRFSAPGTYLLRLTASNGQTTLNDTIEVTVR
jgi:uncharacterized protein YjdB